MLFNSLHFMIFLPVVFILHWITPPRWRGMLLLIASYYFYMSWNPWFGILLAGTTFIDWFAALKIQGFKIQNSRIQDSRFKDLKIQDSTAAQSPLLTNHQSPLSRTWLLVSILTN